MRRDATPADVDGVVDAATAMGCGASALPGRERAVVGLAEVPGPGDTALLRALPGVEEVVPPRPYRLASREWHPEPTVVRLPNGVRVGGREVVVMAIAHAPADGALLRRLREAGAGIVRVIEASSPASDRSEALHELARAAAGEGLALAAKVGDERSLAQAAEHADLVVIGASEMQDSALLRGAGRAGKPVLVTRGLAATIDELLLAAEMVLAEGNPDVILCESGVRGFDLERRALLDLTAIPVVQALSHLPILADPSASAAAGLDGMVGAAVAAGADGVVLRIDPSPPSEGGPSRLLSGPFELTRMIETVRTVAGAIGRE